MWKILDVFVSLVLSIVACACEQNGSKELYIFVIISLHCLTSLERKKVDRTLTPRCSETLNTIWEKSWFWYFSPQESRIFLTEIDFVRWVSCEKLRKCQKKRGGVKVVIEGWEKWWGALKFMKVYGGEFVVGSEPRNRFYAFQNKHSSWPMFIRA